MLLDRGWGVRVGICFQMDLRAFGDVNTDGPSVVHPAVRHYAQSKSVESCLAGGDGAQGAGDIQLNFHRWIEGAVQPKNAGRYDGVMTILSNDLGTLLYSSYVGGKGDDMLRACVVGPDGSVYVAGCTGSPGLNDFPTRKAFSGRLCRSPWIC